MDSINGILHIATRSVSRLGLLALMLVLGLIALALAVVVAVDPMAATSDGTLVAPLRWFSRA